MQVHQVDPIRDPRWSQFLQRHARASIFHTAGWLEALRRTYGYEPIAYTISPPGEDIRNGLVFCYIHSWITGRRIVSLPFSDHCDPLFDSGEEFGLVVAALKAELKQQAWKYLELRPTNRTFPQETEECGLRPVMRYYHHCLDLRPNLNDICSGFDKDSVLRRIRRAERAGFIEKCGRSDDLLEDFYKLLVLTRARHDLPPQPYEWFRNLVDCMGDALEIRLAYKGGIPVAAILTLRFRESVLYKYGCSDASYKSLGGMPLLLWRAISEAKSNNALEFDLGRSDEDNRGLIAFKNHWTQNSMSLVYWRFPGPIALASRGGFKVRIRKRIFAAVPKAALRAAGKFMYRHIG
jgi:hypothetical protein